MALEHVIELIATIASYNMASPVSRGPSIAATIAAATAFAAMYSAPMMPLMWRLPK